MSWPMGPYHWNSKINCFFGDGFWKLFASCSRSSGPYSLFLFSLPHGIMVKDSQGKGDPQWVCPINHNKYVGKFSLYAESLELDVTSTKFSLTYAFGEYSWSGKGLYMMSNTSAQHKVTTWSLQLFIDIWRS